MIGILRDDAEIRSCLPVPATEDYLGVFHDDFGWVTDGSFAMPFTLRSRFGYRRLTFAFQPVQLEAKVDFGAQKAFLNASLEAARELGADCVVQPPMHALFEQAPDGVVCAPCLTYRVDLTREPEAILKAMHKNHRQGIRRVARDHLEVRLGPGEMEACFSTYAATQRRNGVALEYSLEDLSALRGRLGERLVCAAVYDGDALHGGAIMAGDGHGAWALAAGSEPGSHQGAVKAMYWEAMQRFRQVGAPFFDFSGGVVQPIPGSKHDYIQKFKARFGAEALCGCLWKASLRPLRCVGYRVLEGVRDVAHLRWPQSDVIDRERQRHGMRGRRGAYGAGVAH